MLLRVDERKLAATMVWPGIEGCSEEKEIGESICTAGKEVELVSALPA
jgi:hypothetical protein